MTASKVTVRVTVGAAARVTASKGDSEGNSKNDCERLQCS